MATKKKPVGTYIDLFSGCGGLSLGLGNAGWQGVFAVEKDAMAFSTFKHNMIDGKHNHFKWPAWLPKKETTIQALLNKYSEQLGKLKGKVDLIAGGPPCQGFSMAGMRNASDPRNKLSQQYIKMVEIIRPKYILLENVRGFNAAFTNATGKAKKIPYSHVVKEKLENLGYKIFPGYAHAKDFGVPQQRTRFIMVGVRKDVANESLDPFKTLEEIRPVFLETKGLPLRPVTVKEAIGDLETRSSKAKLVHHSGTEETGFKQLDYRPPKKLNAYQTLIRKGLSNERPNGLRLARHKAATIEKFEYIQEVCRPGVVLSQQEKAIIGTRKQAITVLDPKQPSKTLTTLPDDILHYSEPRILTVRESARIQSFPDDFEFQGKYTTGGKERTKECPRYTQVGNAVPPLMGEALGVLIRNIKCNLK
jgi:DNA (cytosine-5)-methyltransferase 1